MANRNVKLKNKSGDVLYPYTDNIPTASTSTAGKVKLDSSPTSGSNNAITSGAVYTALSGKLSTTGTAAKATADASGNNIANTYLAKTGTAAKATADASGNTITTTYATKTELSTVQNSIPNDNNMVHRSGDETIADTKTFEGTINSKGGVNFVNSTITKGTNPSSSQYWAFRFNDKTNSSTWSATRLGVIEGCLDTSGNTSLYFGTYKNEASSTASALLKVGYNLTSGAYAQAPTPAVSSNGTNIATTAYINAKFKKVSALPSSPDANTYYFIPE